MAEISKITLPSGTTYDLKDATARSLIEALGNYTVFLGVTTTALTDGATTNPITISGSNVTARTGDIATYGSQEFIFNGIAWQAFGDLSALGSLAYKNSATGSYTPEGTVSKPTFTGTAGTVSTTLSSNVATAVNDVKVIVDTDQIEQSEFSGYDKSDIATVQHSHTFTGTAKNVSVSGTPTGTISTGTGTANYTPAGRVSTPTISVNSAGSTTTIKNPTSVTVAKTVVAAAPGATAPANALTYYSVSGETLSLYQLGYTTGASITTSNVTVKTGDASYTASQPSFTGTGTELKFTGDSLTSTGSYTPSGSVSNAETNVGVGVKMTYSKPSTSGSFTPSGSVSQPTFTGTAKNVTVS